MVIPNNFDIRERFAIGQCNADFRIGIAEIKDRYKPYHDGEKPYLPEVEITEGDYNLRIPPWICQSYVRAPPDEHIKKLELHEKLAADPNTIKRQFFDDDGNEISRKRMKKLRRVNRRPPAKPEGRHERASELCPKCQQPKGIKCEFRLCRPCCREHCFTTPADCSGHKVLIKTKREKREKLAEIECK